MEQICCAPACSSTSVAVSLGTSSSDNKPACACEAVAASPGEKLAPPEWYEELKVLQAEVSRLDAECKELRAMNAIKDPGRVIGSAEEEAHPERLRNIYSYAVHVVLTGPPLAAMVATLQLIAVALATILYAYAFFDASWLRRVEGDYEAFAGIAVGNFYDRASRYASGVPRVLHYAQIIGCILLGTMVRGDDAETLQTPFPAAIAFCRVDSCRAFCWWRVPLLVTMQLLWTSRVITPVFMLVGVGHNLSGAADAVSVVIDALAAGFLVDLDTLAYDLIVSKQSREAYERSPPAALSPLAVPAAATTRVDTIVEVYTTLEWVLVVSISLVCLESDDVSVNGSGPFSINTFRRDLLCVFLARVCLLGVAHAHLAYVHLACTNAQLCATPHRTALVAARLVALPLVATACGGLAFRVYTELDRVFGYNGWTVYGKCLYTCLRSFPSEMNGTACFGGILEGTCGAEDWWSGYSYS